MASSFALLISKRANLLEGETVIGGCYQQGNWNGEIDLNLAERMLKRAVKYCPELTNGQGVEALEIVKHAVGLRPVREGGTRVGRENLDGLQVVHSYGHGGYGCKRCALFPATLLI